MQMLRFIFETLSQMKKKPHVLVIIDNRERALLEQWKSLTSDMPYEIATAPLDVGDVWVCRSDERMHVPAKNLLFGTLSDTPQDATPFPPPPTIVVERKTVADLNASYADGRYRDQKMRLINCQAPHVVMMIEGHSAKCSSSDKKRLLSTYCNSMFRDGLHVYHTSGVRESFEWLQHTCQQMCKGKLDVDEEQRKRTKYTDVVKMSKKSNLTPSNALEMQLATIPGMSAKMARGVVERYPTMMDLCQALEWCDEPRQLLRDVLGPVRAERVYEFLSGH